MKKLFCILLCALILIPVAACAEKTPTPIEKKYDLSEKEISDDMDIQIVDQKGEIWIEAENIDSIFVCYEESKGRYLEVRVDEKGAKKLKRVSKKKNRELSLVINGEVMATPITKHEYYNDCIVYIAEYAEIMNCFNAVKTKKS